MQFDPLISMPPIMIKIASSVLIGFPVKKSYFLVKAEILENSLCWHDILILTYILLRTMFLFYKIINYWRSFQSAALRIWTMIGYCKFLEMFLMLLFTFYERFVMLITWTWQTLIYMINLLSWKRFQTTITIFSLLETEQKTERN